MCDKPNENSFYVPTLTGSLNDIYRAFIIKLSEAFIHDHCQ